MAKLRIDPESARLTSLQLESDGIVANFSCVLDTQSRQLVVLLAPETETVDRSVCLSRVCAQLATSLCSVAEEAQCSKVHICLRKGNRSSYAAWMRAFLYMGFTLVSKSKVQRLLKQDSDKDHVVLKLDLKSSIPSAEWSDSSTSTHDDESSDSMSSASSVVSTPGRASLSDFLP